MYIHLVSHSAVRLNLEVIHRLKKTATLSDLIIGMSAILFYDKAFFI